jgi:hypothetical protein
MKEGIDRQGMHTFWKNYISKLKKERTKGGIHASALLFATNESYI